jgi:hypothetical protein
MSDIEDRVQRLLGVFEKAKDPYALESAAELVESLAAGDDEEPRARQARRAHQLDLWLSVLNHLDRHRDPHFDFADEPDLAVAPPVAAGAISLTGMESKAVQDPALRREYEEAIERNREKAERYRFQDQLRRLHERLTRRAEAFITSAYSPSPEDVSALMGQVQTGLQNVDRVRRIRQLYP